MNTPTQISRGTLRDLGAEDAFAVRVILHSVNNAAPARLRARTRHYIFERSGILNAHVLDIPMSVWMNGVDTEKRYRDSKAVCDDFREIQQRYTIHVVPWKPSKIEDPALSAETATEAAAATPEPLKRLLRAMGAPEQVEQAMAMLDAGANNEEMNDFVDRTIALLAEPETEANPAPAAARQKTAEEIAAEVNAERARRMREAKAAKKSQHKDQ